jgi:hypothetical protein
MVPMTTSHGPGDGREDHDRGDRQGNDQNAGDGAQHSVKMRLARSGDSLWWIAETVLIVVYRNIIQKQTSIWSSGWPTKLYQSGFAVIANHTLNSRCSRRLCARLARNRVIIVAGWPSAARRTCTPGSTVLLADSAIRLGQLAVIATPSRTRPAQNATGSSASIP